MAGITFSRTLYLQFIDNEHASNVNLSVGGFCVCPDGICSLMNDVIFRTASAIPIPIHDFSISFLHRARGHRGAIHQLRRHQSAADFEVLDGLILCEK